MAVLEKAAEALDQLIAQQSERARIRDQMLVDLENGDDANDFVSTKKMLENSIAERIQLKAGVDKLKVSLVRAEAAIEKLEKQAKKDMERLLAAKKKEGGSNGGETSFENAPFWLEMKSGMDIVAKKVEYAAVDMGNVLRKIEQDTNLAGSALAAKNSNLRRSFDAIETDLEDLKRYLRVIADNF